MRSDCRSSEDLTSSTAESSGVHERIVTGGGKPSVKLFRAVNTVLSSLKTALWRTYHAFDFVTSSSASRATLPKHSTASTGGSNCVRTCGA